MKKLFLIVPFMLLVLIMSAQRPYSNAFDLDTINTTASLDTAAFTCTKTFSQDMKVGFYINATEISGTSNIVVHYQTAAEGETRWYTIATDTISASGYVDYRTTDAVSKVRIYCLAPSSTQSTKLDVSIIAIKDN